MHCGLRAIGLYGGWSSLCRLLPLMFRESLLIPACSSILAGLTCPIVIQILCHIANITKSCHMAFALILPLSYVASYFRQNHIRLQDVEYVHQLVADQPTEALKNNLQEQLQT